MENSPRLGCIYCLYHDDFGVHESLVSDKNLNYFEGMLHRVVGVYVLQRLFDGSPLMGKSIFFKKKRIFVNIPIKLYLVI